MATALVTGATAGLGAEFVRQLSESGWDVVLVARDKARLEKAADEARDRGVEAEVLPADLSVRVEVERVGTRIADPENPVDLLVNNAGMGIGRRFLQSDLTTQDSSLEVMVRAVMVLSHTAARAMVRRGHGAILNVSSIAAKVFNGTYSANKAWVDTFTHGLASELKGTGVTATVVLPGLMRTEFHDRAGLDYSGKPSFVWLTTQKVVRSSLKAVRRGRVSVTPSLRYKFVIGVIAPLYRGLRRK